MKNKITLSIIVPVYNAEKHIERLILSIDNNHKVEIIIVDDGSSDSSKIIINRLAKKISNIKYYYKDNSGVSNARNYGIEVARGEYITFADADDFYEKGFINKIIDILTKEKLEMVCFNYYKTYNDIKYKKLSLNDDLICGDKKSNLIKYINGTYSNMFCNSVWNKVYRKDIIKENKISFPENKKVGEDLIFNINYISKINNIKTLKDVGYNYYFNSNSVMNIYRKKNVDEIITSVNILSKLCKDNKINNYKRILGEFYVRRFYGIFNNELKSEKYEYGLNKIEKFCNNSIINYVNLKDLNLRELLYFIIIKTKLYKIMFKLKYQKGVKKI